MKLKEYRKQYKITQQKLASILGVSRSAIAMWETGDNEPDHAMLVRIAEYFGISVDELLGHAPTVPSENKKIQPAEHVSKLDSELFSTISSLAPHEKQVLITVAEGLIAARSGALDLKAAQEEAPSQE